MSYSLWRSLEFTFTFHFHPLGKEMATHSSVLAWRIPGMAEPGGLLSMGSHRVGHNWSDLAAAAEFPKLSMDRVLSCLQDFHLQSGPSYYPSLPGPAKKLPLFCIPHKPFPTSYFPLTGIPLLVLYYFYNHFWIRLYFLVFLFVCFCFLFSFLPHWGQNPT